MSTLKLLNAWLNLQSANKKQTCITFLLGTYPVDPLCGAVNTDVPFGRRMDGSVDFYRYWADYKAGFGDPAGEFWLGLDQLHTLTTNGNYGLRVTYRADNGDVFCALYSHISVNDESDNYRLSVSGYQAGNSNAGDSLIEGNPAVPFANRYHNGMEFSTRDRDNDLSVVHCANSFTTAGWLNRCGTASMFGVHSIGSIGWYTAYGDYIIFPYTVWSLMLQ